MKHCPRCGSANTRPYPHKPPKKHPPGQTGCTADCTQVGLFCRRCRVVTVSRETLKEENA